MWGQFMEKEIKTVIPTMYEQQIILTCKGHNKNKNNIEAIRNILSKQFGLDTEYVYDSVIYRWLIKIVKKYANYRTMDNFLDSLFERKDEITVIDAVKDLISILASIDILDKDGQELIHLEKNPNVAEWINE